MEKLKKKKVRNEALRDNKAICRHDYKNAIQIGNVDYVCPLCKELLDPFEWFFMNSFEFVEAETQTEVNSAGSQSVTFCHGLKLEITDGKRRNKNERIFLGKNDTGW